MALTNINNVKDNDNGDDDCDDEDDDDNGETCFYLFGLGEKNL